jgi:enterochelin esterase-like enzyme
VKHLFRTLLAALALSVAGCGPSSHNLDYRSLDSRELDREMAYAILAPPAGDAGGEPRRVFYLLHGFGDDHRSLDRFGVSDSLLEAMRAGRLPRAYVVAPNGERGFYINWYDGTNDYEDYLLEEIVPTAEEELGIEVDVARRHVIGVSMGGLGAVQLGLRHPELFGSMSSLSGFFPDVHEAKALVEDSPLLRRAPLKRIFGDCSDREFVDAHNPYQIVRRRESHPPQRIFLAVGDRDREDFVRTNQAFHELLESEGVAHEYVVYDGRHRWSDWAPLVERAMRYAEKPYLR